MKFIDPDIKSSSNNYMNLSGVPDEKTGEAPKEEHQHLREIIITIGV